MKVWWSINYSFFIIVIGKVNWYINQMSSITKKNKLLETFLLRNKSETIFCSYNFWLFLKDKRVYKNCFVSKLGMTANYQKQSLFIKPNLTSSLKLIDGLLSHWAKH